MKIHVIKSEHGAQYQTHCGLTFIDPERECGTLKQELSTCGACKSSFGSVNKLRAELGFKIKIPCPNCGRMMSPASMVKHNRWEELSGY